MNPISYRQIFQQLRQRIALSIAGKPPTPKTSGKRSYSGALQNRLFADWLLSVQTGDASLQNNLLTLRDRCRDMDRNNPWIRRYLEACEDNILKPRVAFSLQMQCTFPPDFKKPDKMARDLIEMKWAEWSQKKNCTSNGEDSLFEVCRLSVRSQKRDGGILIRKIKDPNINQFGFALRMIEIDHLDHNYTTKLSNGSRVVMGVEKNSQDKVTAYYLLEGHPGDLLFGGNQGNRIRVPADEIIHYYRKERVTQSIGVPEIAPVVVRNRHLDQYEEAELVASRKGAAKGVYFINAQGNQYKGESAETSDDASSDGEGAQLSDTEPGQDEQLPAGTEVVPYDPKHPTDAFGEFLKYSLLGISAGSGISYMTLTGDLSQANYSSLRSGSLSERKGWIKAQGHMIENLILPIFDEWLPAAILNGAIKLPYSKLAQFNRPKFIGCRWEWVDPEKDVNAATKAVDAGFTSRSQICDETGEDFEEVCQQQQIDEDLADEYDLEFATQMKPMVPEPAITAAEPQPANDAQGNQPARNGYHFSS
jgi:lambda family phage portal protein